MNSLESAIRTLLIAAAVVLSCSVAVAQNAGSETDSSSSDYSVQEFVDMREEADALYDQFEAMEEDEAGRRDVAQEALRKRVALIEYLDEWQDSGTMPQSLVDSAVESRFVIYQNIVNLYSELLLCDDARSAADVMQELMRGQRLTSTSRQALTTARADVVECETNKEELEEQQARRERERQARDEAARQQQEEETARAAALAAETEEAEKRRDVIGISLVSAGGASAIGALGWAIAGSNASSDRQDLYDSSCNTNGVCDPSVQDEFDSLDSKVKSARWGTLTLGIASAGLITSGLVLWLRSPDREGAEDSDVAATDFGVSFTRGGAYARFHTRF
jgi:type II secretory pathway pseudopilin PulG